jgi:hypothetical protein
MMAELVLVKGSVPPNIRAALEAGAESLDLNTGTYLAAILTGVLRTGNAERFALVGLDHVPHKRRARKSLPWEREGEGPDDTFTVGGTQPEAACWRYQDWTLVRLGHPSGRPGPDDGWYLEGPGLHDAVKVGNRRQDAIDEADVIIRHWEREKRAQQPESA